jgi:hypothetical protein
VKAVDSAGRPVSRARIGVLVKLDGRRIFSGRAATGAAGKTVFRVRKRGAGCLGTTIRGVSASGFVWGGGTPRNRFCGRPPA